jgi:hypothetical protein
VTSMASALSNLPVIELVTTNAEMTRAVAVKKYRCGAGGNCGVGGAISILERSLLTIRYFRSSTFLL